MTLNVNGWAIHTVDVAMWFDGGNIGSDGGAMGFNGEQKHAWFEG